jgi:D-3-phosphoglycerate dehydrogenase
MPVEGDTKFAELKKKYSKGVELRGKTLGIVGFGRIGHETAKMALGLGMDVLVYDIVDVPTTLTLTFSGDVKVDLKVKQVSFEEILKSSDFISLHVPFLGKAMIADEEFALMKDNVGIVNASRGGVIDEKSLLKALDSGKVAFAGLDVFENEPTPLKAILTHPKVSLSPHIGAATAEAQQRVGEELAELIIKSVLVSK